MALKINTETSKSVFKVSAHVLFFDTEPNLFTCIDKGTAVVECAEVRSREREKSMKFAEVIFKPWPCEH